MTIKNYILIGAAVFAGNAMYHSATDSISSTDSPVVEDQPQAQHQVMLYTDKQQVSHTAKDVECLARNIYYEAGVESMLGKIAVGTITVNRVRTHAWGRKICDVVYSPAQFSWTKEKKRGWVELKGRAWADSKAAAEAVLNGLKVRQLDSALYYHADYVQPKWRDDSKRVIKIGRHIFYTQAKDTNIKL